MAEVAEDPLLHTPFKMPTPCSQQVAAVAPMRPTGPVSMHRLGRLARLEEVLQVPVVAQLAHLELEVQGAELVRIMLVAVVPGGCLMVRMPADKARTTTESGD